MRVKNEDLVRLTRISSFDNRDYLDRRMSTMTVTYRARYWQARP